MLYARSTSIEEDGERAAMYWTDLHVVDVETGVDVAVPGGSDPHRCETLADWSPDGQSIVFARSRPYEPCEGHRGQMGLAIVPWNDGRGGEPTELTPAGSGAGSDYQPRFSGDGRWVVFVRSERGFYARGSADLWVVAAAGGTEARKLEVSTPAMESFHAFSPDGRWLAFASNRDRVDRPHIYVARFFDDGHTAPALPFPGPGDPEVVAVNPDW